MVDLEFVELDNIKENIVLCYEKGCIADKDLSAMLKVVEWLDSSFSIEDYVKGYTKMYPLIKSIKTKYLSKWKVAKDSFEMNYGSLFRKYFNSNKMNKASTEIVHQLTRSSEEYKEILSSFRPIDIAKDTVCSLSDSVEKLEPIIIQWSVHERGSR